MEEIAAISNICNLYQLFRSTSSRKPCVREIIKESDGSLIYSGASIEELGYLL